MDDGTGNVEEKRRKTEVSVEPIPETPIVRSTFKEVLVGERKKPAWASALSPLTGPNSRRLNQGAPVPVPTTPRGEPPMAPSAAASTSASSTNSDALNRLQTQNDSRFEAIEKQVHHLCRAVEENQANTATMAAAQSNQGTQLNRIELLLASLAGGMPPSA